MTENPSRLSLISSRKKKALIAALIYLIWQGFYVWLYIDSHVSQTLELRPPPPDFTSKLRRALSSSLTPVSRFYFNLLEGKESWIPDPWLPLNGCSPGVQTDSDFLSVRICPSADLLLCPTSNMFALQELTLIYMYDPWMSYDSPVRDYNESLSGVKLLDLVAWVTLLCICQWKKENGRS